MGEIVAAAQTTQEEIIMADIDVEQVRQTRTRFPFLDDR
jgi:predicted amidohydrolase